MTRDCVEHGVSYSRVAIENMLNPTDEDDVSEHLSDVAQAE